MLNVSFFESPFMPPLSATSRWETFPSKFLIRAAAAACLFLFSQGGRGSWRAAGERISSSCSAATATAAAVAMVTGPFRDMEINAWVLIVC